MTGGEGTPDLSPSATVTARVLDHVLGEKVRIGKYRQRTGYKRHNGYRSRLTQIQIESIGGAAKKAAPAKQEETADAPAKLPRGYGDMTVADINEKSGRWTAEQVEAALEYERAHAKRKGALAALEARKEHLDGS